MGKMRSKVVTCRICIRIGGTRQSLRSPPLARSVFNWRTRAPSPTLSRKLTSPSCSTTFLVSTVSFSSSCCSAVISAPTVMRPWHRTMTTSPIFWLCKFSCMAAETISQVSSAGTLACALLKAAASPPIHPAIATPARRRFCPGDQPAQHLQLSTPHRQECLCNSRQRHDSHPEHILCAYVQVVLAREIELAVALYAEDGKAGGDGAHSSRAAHDKLHHVGRDENLAARVESKRARVNSARVRVLDQRRLAGLLVDREHSDAVLSADEHRLPLEIRRAARSIRDVHILPARMHVNRPERLPRPHVAGLD